MYGLSNYGYYFRLIFRMCSLSLRVIEAKKLSCNGVIDLTIRLTLVIAQVSINNKYDIPFQLFFCYLQSKIW